MEFADPDPKEINASAISVLNLASEWQVQHADFDHESGTYWAIAFASWDGFQRVWVIGIDTRSGRILNTEIIVEGECWASIAYSQHARKLFLIDSNLRNLAIVNLGQHPAPSCSEWNWGGIFSGCTKLKCLNLTMHNRLCVCQQQTSPVLPLQHARLNLLMRGRGRMA